MVERILLEVDRSVRSARSEWVVVNLLVTSTAYLSWKKEETSLSAKVPEKQGNEKKRDD